MRGFRTSIYAALAVLAGVSSAKAGNLLVNGNFEAGNTGFTSAYAYSPGNLGPAGVYDIVPDPHDDHPVFASFGDHTTGSGLMMAINGADVAGVNVWEEATIAVAPHRTYLFSMWIASATSQAPAILNLSINGAQVGATFTPTGVTGVWQQFTATWSSGSATSADLALVNENTSFAGNDFAIDDLSLTSLSAVPEPSTWAMLLAGLGGLGAALRRRAVLQAR